MKFKIKIFPKLVLPEKYDIISNEKFDKEFLVDRVIEGKIYGYYLGNQYLDDVHTYKKWPEDVKYLILLSLNSA